MKLGLWSVSAIACIWCLPSFAASPRLSGDGQKNGRAAGEPSRSVSEGDVKNQILGLVPPEAEYHLALLKEPSAFLNDTTTTPPACDTELTCTPFYVEIWVTSHALPSSSGPGGISCGYVDVESTLCVATQMGVEYGYSFLPAQGGALHEGDFTTCGAIQNLGACTFASGGVGVFPNWVLLARVKQQQDDGPGYGPGVNFYAKQPFSSSYNTSIFGQGQADPVGYGQACGATVGCSDGNDCTHHDTCSNGACAGTPYVCNDNNVCTNDSCNGDGTCTFTNNTSSCNDGVPCTVNDICTNGVCGGTAKDCSALTDQCNTGVCNAATGVCEAQPANEGGTCDDGFFCTVADACTNGVCGGTDNLCDDNDVCTVDTCDQVAGCEHVAMPGPCEIYDVDGNGEINTGDFSYFAGCWLLCPGSVGYTTPNPPYLPNGCEDVNFVGCGTCVGPEDFSYFVTAWLANLIIPTGTAAIALPPAGCSSNVASANEWLPLPTDAMLLEFGLDVPPRDWEGWQRGVLPEILQQQAMPVAPVKATTKRAHSVR